MEKDIKVKSLLLELHKAARNELNPKTQLLKIQKHNAKIMELVKVVNSNNSGNYYGA